MSAIRLQQWIKNLLVFVPLLTSHNYGNSNLVTNTIIAFIAFSLCSSSVYLINDIFDLEEDRNHPIKANRPIASGRLSIFQGVAIVSILLLLCIVFALVLPPNFSYVLLIYFSATFLYTIYFKFIILIDIVMLAMFYCARIIAGAVVINVHASTWLMAFSVFIFLSLAALKRYCELMMMDKEFIITTTRYRAYVGEDKKVLSALGCTSAGIAILIIVLYINSLSHSQAYNYPGILWMTCPILLYWTGYIWLQASRGNILGDPLRFVIVDKLSWLVASSIFVAYILAI